MTRIRGSRNLYRRNRSALLTLLALLCLALAAGVQAAAKRPMTFQDVIEMRAVGAGKISPNGKFVVYTVSIPQWKAGKNFTDLFVAPSDGSAPPRQLTFTKEKNETQPQWARDSRTVGFLSDRESTAATPINQLYLMRIDGGEARPGSDTKDGELCRDRESTRLNSSHSQ